MLSLAGCKTDDDTGNASDTDAINCPECAPDEDVYACIIDGEEVGLCFDSLASAQQTCGSKPGNGVVGDGPTVCDNQSPRPGIDWTPSNFVVYDAETHTHQIDVEFFDNLQTNPDQLLHDGARVEWRGDHFEFETIKEGDLADMLGFQNGDQLLSVNEHPLTTMADAFSAFDAMYDKQTFVVEVEREEEIIVLRYALQ